MQIQRPDMRVLRCLLCLIGFFVACACSPQSSPVVGGLIVESVEQSAADELPERVIVSLEIDNPSYAVKLRDGQVKIGYRGRNVVILSLEERVRIAARSRERVELALKVSVARNSLAIEFKEALRRGEVSDVRVGWQVDARIAGLKRYEIAQSDKPLSELLSDEQIAQLREYIGE